MYGLWESQEEEGSERLFEEMTARDFPGFMRCKYKHLGGQQTPKRVSSDSPRDTLQPNCPKPNPESLESNKK